MNQSNPPEIIFSNLFSRLVVYTNVSVRSENTAETLLPWVMLSKTDKITSFVLLDSQTKLVIIE